MLIAPTGGSGTASKPISLLPQTSKKSSRAIEIHQPSHSVVSSSISQPLSPQSPFIKNGQIDQDKLRRYKTQLCPRGEVCQFGVQCEFAHGRDELRRSLDVIEYAPVLCTIPGCRDPTCKFSHNLCESQYHPDVYKTKICSYWTKEGVCARGAYCTFAHGQDDLRVKKRVSVGGSQTPMLSSRPGLRVVDSGRRHSTGGLAQHIGLALSPLQRETRRDWFDIRFKNHGGLDHMEQFDKSYQPDEHDKHVKFESHHAKHGTIDDDGTSSISEAVETEELDEAIALLTGDREQLSPYSLTPLKQLRTLIHDARVAVDEVISNYDTNHPTRTCLLCSAPVRSILKPCNHGVLCDSCLADVTNCPHCQCPIKQHVAIKRDLPSVLVDNRASVCYSSPLDRYQHT